MEEKEEKEEEEEEEIESMSFRIRQVIELSGGVTKSVHSERTMGSFKSQMTPTDR